MNKLLQFQQQVGAIAKDSKNPFFNSKYFDINGVLEAVKPVMSELGLIISQPLTNLEGKPAIQTLIIDATDSKVLLESIIPLPELSDPQKMGSAITYFRRYSLQSMLALQADDDDGNHASQPAKPAVTLTDTVGLLRTKVANLSGKKNLTEKETLDLIDNHSGVRLNTVKEINHDTAKEILNLFKD